MFHSHPENNTDLAAICFDLIKSTTKENRIEKLDILVK
jgi:hypothetical protein